MTTNIYILRLKYGRYYVGKSENVIKRYQEHLNGSGSAWTRKYKPINLIKIISNQTDFDEDKWVKVYMNKYVIENVRGGSYTTEELSAFQLKALEAELRGSTNKCMKCGRAGHWASDCFAKTELTNLSEDSEEEIWICEKCNEEFDDNNECKRHERWCRKNRMQGTQNCYRCGYSGHYAPDCYASRHINGYYLD